MTKNIKKENLLAILNNQLDVKDFITTDEGILINYKSLFELYPLKCLNKYCKDNKDHKTFIHIDKLINFFDDYVLQEEINSKIENIPIIYPLIFGLYNLEYLNEEIIIEDHKYIIYYNYNWSKLNKIIKCKIEPKKLIFIICDLIRKNISNRFNDELDVSFEITRKNKNAKYNVIISLSDITLRSSNLTEKDRNIIIIEIEQNNKKKEEIINSDGVIIKYFYENNINNIDFAELLHTCHEVLIATSKNYRNRSLLSESQILINKKINELNEELNLIDTESKQFKLIENSINNWKNILNNKEIKKFYNYKILSDENIVFNILSKYNIPLKIIIKQLNLDINIETIGNQDKNKDKKLVDNLILEYARIIKGNYYFSYDNVFRFMIKLSTFENKEMIDHFTNVLLCSQEIYENYIKIINKYNNNIINTFKQSNKIIKDTVTEQLEKKYDLIINEKDNEIKNYKEELEKNVTPKKVYGSDFDSDLENQEEESDLDIE